MEYFRRLYVLITVNVMDGISKLTFAYDVLKDGECKNARTPENLDDSTLTEAIRFTNHCIVKSKVSCGDFLYGKYTLFRDAFQSIELDNEAYGFFRSLIRSSTRRNEPLENVTIRWYAK